MNLVSSLVISGISFHVLRLGHDYPKVRIPIFVRSFFWINFSIDLFKSDPEFGLALITVSSGLGFCRWGRRCIQARCSELGLPLRRLHLSFFPVTRLYAARASRSKLRLSLYL
jgi:hypothetical protein